MSQKNNPTPPKPKILDIPALRADARKGTAISLAQALYNLHNQPIRPATQHKPRAATPVKIAPIFTEPKPSDANEHELPNATLTTQTAPIPVAAKTALDAASTQSGSNASQEETAQAKRSAIPASAALAFAHTPKIKERSRQQLSREQQALVRSSLFTLSTPSYHETPTASTSALGFGFTPVAATQKAAQVQPLTPFQTIAQLQSAAQIKTIAPALAYNQIASSTAEAFTTSIEQESSQFTPPSIKFSSAAAQQDPEALAATASALSAAQAAFEKAQAKAAGKAARAAAKNAATQTSQSTITPATPTVQTTATVQSDPSAPASASVPAILDARSTKVAAEAASTVSTTAPSLAATAQAAKPANTVQKRKSAEELRAEAELEARNIWENAVAAHEAEKDQEPLDLMDEDIAYDDDAYADIAVDPLEDEANAQDIPFALSSTDYTRAKSTQTQSKPKAKTKAKAAADTTQPAKISTATPEREISERLMAPYLVTPTKSSKKSKSAEELRAEADLEIRKMWDDAVAAHEDEKAREPIEISDESAYDDADYDDYADDDAGYDDFADADIDVDPLEDDKTLVEANNESAQDVPFALSPSDSTLAKSTVSQIKTQAKATKVADESAATTTHEQSPAQASKSRLKLLRKFAASAQACKDSTTTKLKGKNAKIRKDKILAPEIDPDMTFYNALADSKRQADSVDALFKTAFAPATPQTPAATVTVARFTTVTPQLDSAILGSNLALTPDQLALEDLSNATRLARVKAAFLTAVQSSERDAQERAQLDSARTLPFDTKVSNATLSDTSTSFQAGASAALSDLTDSLREVENALAASSIASSQDLSANLPAIQTEPSVDTTFKADANDSTVTRDISEATSAADLSSVAAPSITELVLAQLIPAYPVHLESFQSGFMSSSYELVAPNTLQLTASATSAAEVYPYLISELDLALPLTELDEPELTLDPNVPLMDNNFILQAHQPQILTNRLDNSNQKSFPTILGSGSTLTTLKAVLDVANQLKHQAIIAQHNQVQANTQLSCDVSPAATYNQASNIALSATPGNLTGTLPENYPDAANLMANRANGTDGLDAAATLPAQDSISQTAETATSLALEDSESAATATDVSERVTTDATTLAKMEEQSAKTTKDAAATTSEEIESASNADEFDDYDDYAEDYAQAADRAQVDALQSASRSSYAQALSAHKLPPQDVVDAANAYFDSLTKDMGEEFRLNPYSHMIQQRSLQVTLGSLPVEQQSKVINEYFAVFMQALNLILLNCNNRTLVEQGLELIIEKAAPIFEAEYKNFFYMCIHAAPKALFWMLQYPFFSNFFLVKQRTLHLRLPRNAVWTQRLIDEQIEFEVSTTEEDFAALKERFALNNIPNFNLQDNMLLSLYEEKDLQQGLIKPLPHMTQRERIRKLVKLGGAFPTDPAKLRFKQVNHQIFALHNLRVTELRNMSMALEKLAHAPRRLSYIFKKDFKHYSMSMQLIMKKMGSWVELFPKDQLCLLVQVDEGFRLRAPGNRGTVYTCESFKEHPLIILSGLEVCYVALDELPEPTEFTKEYGDDTSLQIKMNNAFANLSKQMAELQDNLDDDDNDWDDNDSDYASNSASYSACTGSSGQVASKAAGKASKLTGKYANEADNDDDAFTFDDIDGDEDECDVKVDQNKLQASDFEVSHLEDLFDSYVEPIEELEDDETFDFADENAVLGEHNDASTDLESLNKGKAPHIWNVAKDAADADSSDDADAEKTLNKLLQKPKFNDHFAAYDDDLDQDKPSSKEKSATSYSNPAFVSGVYFGTEGTAFPSQLKRFNKRNLSVDSSKVGFMIVTL